MCVFQFWDEPRWDREFLRYQRPRDSQTDGGPHNSQHQPFLLVRLQQRLHHQLSRVSGWWLCSLWSGLSVFGFGSVCVCSREKGACLFSCSLAAASLYNPLPPAGRCGDPLGCLICNSFPTYSHPFHHRASCQTSLWLCMITGCLPPLHPCTTRRVMLELMWCSVVMCRPAAFNHCSAVMCISQRRQKLEEHK